MSAAVLELNVYHLISVFTVIDSRLCAYCFTSASLDWPES